MTAADTVIVGLGYVGLPLALAAHASGWHVRGLDRDDERVGLLNGGRSHVDDVSDDDVAAAVAQGFGATCESTCLDRADTVVICVPTPLLASGEPDLRAVMSVGETIQRHLRPGMLVVLESTTYPGTTEGPLRRTLERGGLVAGEDFSLAFSPERIWPGMTQYRLESTPKIVGGLTEDCTRRATEFYSRFIDHVVPTVGTREAEAAKLLENTYRYVNIALVNELLTLSADLEVDLWTTIGLAATKPFGFHAFYPGPGVGGHCIPVDPNFLSYAARQVGRPLRFIELAHEVNSRMPEYVVARIQSVLNDVAKPVRGSRIALLGVSYNANVSDDRETPARPIASQLAAMGAELSYHDPLTSRFMVDGAPMRRVDDLREAVAPADLAVFLQAHDAIDLDVVVDAARLVLDTRGKMVADNVVRL